MKIKVQVLKVENDIMKFWKDTFSFARYHFLVLTFHEVPLLETEKMRSSTSLKLKIEKWNLANHDCMRERTYINHSNVDDTKSKYVYDNHEYVKHDMNFENKHVIMFFYMYA